MDSLLPENGGNADAPLPDQSGVPDSFDSPSPPDSSGQYDQSSVPGLPQGDDMQREQNGTGRRHNIIELFGDERAADKNTMEQTDSQMDDGFAIDTNGIFNIGADADDSAAAVSRDAVGSRSTEGIRSAEDGAQENNAARGSAQGRNYFGDIEHDGSGAQYAAPKNGAARGENTGDNFSRNRYIRNIDGDDDIDYSMAVSSDRMNRRGAPSAPGQRSMQGAKNRRAAQIGDDADRLRPGRDDMWNNRGGNQDDYSQQNNNGMQNRAELKNRSDSKNRTDLQNRFDSQNRDIQLGQNGGWDRDEVPVQNETPFRNGVPVRNSRNGAPRTGDRQRQPSYDGANQPMDGFQRPPQGGMPYTQDGMQQQPQGGGQQPYDARMRQPQGANQRQPQNGNPRQPQNAGGQQRPPQGANQHLPQNANQRQPQGANPRQPQGAGGGQRRQPNAGGGRPPQQNTGGRSRQQGSGGGQPPTRGGPPGGKRKSRAAQIVNIALIIFSIVIIVAIVMIYRQSSQKLENEAVYDGVYVGGDDVSEMTYDELVIYLEGEYGGSLENKFITIKIGDVTERHSFADLGVRYNIEEVAKQAYNIGRTGSGIDRIRKISDIEKNKVNLNLVYTYNREKVDGLVNRIADEAGVLTEDAEVRYTPTSVIIKPGREGVRIDKDDLSDKLRSALDKFESIVIDVKLIMSQPDRLDAEKIFETIYKEATDAYYKVSDDHKQISIEPEVLGQTVDRSRLSSAVASLNNSSSAEVTVPLVPVQPTVKKADLSMDFFNDKLGTASTNFTVNSTNNRNRRDNMTLATQTITGYILAPEDEFAFNEAVGKRTEANGYKMAGAFMNGQLIDDVGGGICQVSSTLYNAVLYADLTVTQRQNHSYLVSYVTKGFDATVSYPLPDFKFKNSSEHPVMINCGVDGTTISFTIMGTQVGPVKKISFSSEVRDSKEYTTVTTEDPTMPVGTTHVTQAGRVGYTIDTYKTIQIGDGPKETVKVATNKYKAMEQLETVGTMPVPPGEENPEQTIIEPSPDDEDYVSEAGQTPQNGQEGTNGLPVGENGQPGGGEGEGDVTTRPIRTPRPSRNVPSETTTAAASSGRSTTAADGATEGEPTATASQGETSTRAPRETTTAAAAGETTRAAETTTATADANGGTEAPRRTPRPARN